jgi:hypothetical protein
VAAARRDALKTPPPNHHRSIRWPVFTRDGSCVGMTSWPAWTPCAGCTDNTAERPNREHDLPAARSTSSERSRLRTDTLLNPNGLPPQAVDGRIMSVLKQHLHVTQERYATPLAHGHPLTYWSTNPIDAAFGARIDPYSVPWKAHQSPSHHRQRPHRAGGPLGPHVYAMQRRGSGHNP